MAQVFDFEERRQRIKSQQRQDFLSALKTGGELAQIPSTIELNRAKTALGGGSPSDIIGMLFLQQLLGGGGGLGGFQPPTGQPQAPQQPLGVPPQGAMQQPPQGGLQGMQPPMATPQGINVPSGVPNFLQGGILNALNRGQGILPQTGQMPLAQAASQFDLTKAAVGGLTFENLDQQLDHKQAEQLLDRPLTTEQFSDLKDINIASRNINRLFEDLTSNEEVLKSVGPLKLEAMDVPVISDLAAQFADKRGEFAAFKAETKKFFQQYRKVITGAQASYREISILEPIFPKTSDRPEVFIAKLKAARRSLEIILDAYKSVLPTGGFRESGLLDLPDDIKIRMFDVLQDFNSEVNTFDGNTVSDEEFSEALKRSGVLGGK